MEARKEKFPERILDSKVWNLTLEMGWS